MPVTLTEMARATCAQRGIVRRKNTDNLDVLATTRIESFLEKVIRNSLTMDEFNKKMFD